MPVEIGDRAYIYACASGQAEIERVEFIADSAPGRLMLDPRARAHDWNMLNNAQTYVLYAPWVAVYPGFMITVTVLSFNFAGDGLRDALDPRLSVS